MSNYLKFLTSISWAGSIPIGIGKNHQITDAIIDENARSWVNVCLSHRETEFL